MALKLQGQTIEMFPLERRFIKCDRLGQMVWICSHETLLVKSKTRGEVTLHPTFKGKKTAIIPLVTCTPLTWKFHCSDLTNSVNRDEVCTSRCNGSIS